MKFVKKIKGIIYSISASLLALPFVSAAQPPSIPRGEGSIESLYEKFIVIVQYIFGIALAIGIILIIWGGVGWMMAGGDEEKITTARRNLLYGVIGIAIIIGVYVIINAVASFLGLTVDLPS